MPPDPADAEVPPSHPLAPRPVRRHRPNRTPLSSERIVDAALAIMEREGYEAVTMRGIAHELGTGPASLYAHIDGKRELDALLVDRVAREVHIPDPDPEHWQQQIVQVGHDLRAAMLRHPGVARAVIGYIPTGPEAMTTTERMLAILLAGGVVPQVAAWACDLLPLYVTAVAFEDSVGHQDLDMAGPAVDQFIAELRGYFRSLPPDRFPHVVAQADVLTTGDGEVRFAFGLQVLVAGLAAVSASWPAAGDAS
jgi:AcrR family transcriptional regulator